MIRVVRIAGEGYDLDTGEAHPKSLVLTNGYREVFLPVDDQAVHAVLEMVAEVAAVELKKAPEGNGGLHEHELEKAMAAETHEGIKDSVAVKLREGCRPVLGELPDEPVEELYEPGEEYSDPATGVGSL